MKRLMLIAAMVWVATAGTALAAAPALDFMPDVVGDWTGDSVCEIYSIGVAHDVATNRLNFQIRTDYAKAGYVKSDSYTSSTHFSPGDVVIAVNSLDLYYPHPQTTFHGIAVTTHANVVEQAYPGEVWTNVTEGNLYTNATFADGTYENYENDLNSLPQAFGPPDGDGDTGVNSYFSLIKTGTEVVGKSAITYTPVADTWDYEISGWVDMTAIGLDPLGGHWAYAVGWSMECGNDAAVQFNASAGFRPVPEPTGLLLADLSLLGLRGRRRS